MQGKIYNIIQCMFLLKKYLFIFHSEIQLSNNIHVVDIILSI